MATYSLSPDVDRRLRQRAARRALWVVPVLAGLVALTLSDPSEIRALALLIPTAVASTAYVLWRS